jgi:hypothetical protein
MSVFFALNSKGRRKRKRKYILNRHFYIPLEGLWKLALLKSKK